MAALFVALAGSPSGPVHGSPDASSPDAARVAQATSICDPAWLAALGPRPRQPQEALLRGLSQPGNPGAADVSLPPPHGAPHVFGVVDGTSASPPDGRSDAGDRSLAERSGARVQLDAADLSQGTAPTRPNDEYRDLQNASLGLVLHAYDAWQVSYGRSDVTIAIISDGVDMKHPDLDGKIWRNPDEIRGNRVDDDGNGYIDDVNGWDFGRVWNAPTKGDNLPQPIDFGRRAVARFGNRGTQMAGIAAAETNNGEGIAGVSWGARIMPIKATYAAKDDQGRVGAAFWVKHITEGVCYAAKNEATIILIGGLPFGELIQDEIGYESIKRLSEAIAYAGAKGIPVVAPAGECGVVERRDQTDGCPKGVNPDIFPARSNNANVIGVTAMRVEPDGRFGRRSTMSTGPWVDIAAPGEGFYATINTSEGGDDVEIEIPYQMIDPADQLFGPDDFAAAHVAGVAAVMKTINPTLSPLQVLEHLCRNAHRDESLGEFELGGEAWLRNDTYGCGVLDFERTVEQMPHKIRLGNLILHEFVPLDVPEVERRLVNPYLNADAWEIFTETTWLDDAARSQRRGDASVRSLVVNVENLDRWANGLSSSSVIAPQEIRVCPTNVVPLVLRFTLEDCGLNARTGCACLQLHLRVADHVSRIYLPGGLRAAEFGPDD